VNGPGPDSSGITPEMRAALHARGLDDDTIARLTAEDREKFIRYFTPEEALKRFNGGGASPQPDRDDVAAPLEPDRDEAGRFLTAFDLNTDNFTFQTFDDNKERKKERAEANKLRRQQGKKPLKDPLARVRHGTLAEHWDELVELNNKGAGIYFTPNETDGNGRSAKNITRVRAGFGDLDGAPLEPMHKAKLLPHIINETSPGRYHGYWLIADDMPLDQFEPQQKAIAAHFDADPSIHDLPRVMRLPGFVHRKGTPFLVRILEINKIPPYPWKALQEAFPPPYVFLDPDSAAALMRRSGRSDAPFTSQDLGDLGEGIPDPPGQEVREQWKKLNSEAIRRYSDWVPDIFPAATRTSEGGYRVSSADLGRDLEEDLSFHLEGIKDFGLHDMGDQRGGKRSPIDIVEEHLHKNFNDAVRWLAQKLGLDPNDYLPKSKTKNNDDQQGSGDPTVDAEITRLAALSTVEYERERKTAAKKLGLRTDILEQLVINARARQAYAKEQPAKEEQGRKEKEEAERLLAELNAENCVVLDALGPWCCASRRTSARSEVSITSTVCPPSCASMISATCTSIASSIMAAKSLLPPSASGGSRIPGGGNIAA
jgi:hypothetical protein